MYQICSASTAYYIFEQFVLNAKQIIVVLQPSSAAQRYAGPTHTDSANCRHACTDPWISKPTGQPHPHSRLSARGQFLVCYRALLIRTQIMQIRNYKAAHVTKGSRDIASRFRLTRLRRSASHSATAIFPWPANGCHRRNLMENPGLTFKLIKSRRSASAERSRSVESTVFVLRIRTVSSGATLAQSLNDLSNIFARTENRTRRVTATSSTTGLPCPFNAKMNRGPPPSYHVMM
jgi:hypothetical protein